MELENVKQKIRSMLQMSTRNGCSEGEALIAANLVGKLLQTYNLTLDKVLLDAEQCVEVVVETGRLRSHPVSLCSMAIAHFCDCRVWLDGSVRFDPKDGWSKKGQAYHFFGLVPDTEMAKYLYQLIWDSIDYETNAFRNSSVYKERNNAGVHGKRLTISFQKGMSNRISSRLRQMKYDRNVDEMSNVVNYVDTVTNVQTSTSIVLLKNDKVASEFEKLGLRLRSRQVCTSGTDYSAYGAGKAAGSAINLNRPMGSQSAIAGYLK